MNLPSDYRDTLRHAMETRCQRNPSYSLRAFARDLGLAPSRLHDVLQGRYGLSREAAAKIAKNLGLHKEEAERFCDQVESQHARGKRIRQAAAERLSAKAPAYQPLTLDGFQVISDWYHFAILELTLTEGFQSNAAWIAKELDLSPHVATAAIDRLKRLDLLLEDKEGNLKAADTFTASPGGVPSDAIKKFHRQILEKAITAIDCQALEERDFSSMILAVDSSRVEEARLELKNFRRAFDAKFGASENKTTVYCLSTQLFRLQTKSGATP